MEMTTREILLSKIENVESEIKSDVFRMAEKLQMIYIDSHNQIDRLKDGKACLLEDLENNTKSVSEFAIHLYSLRETLFQLKDLEKVFPK